MLKLFNTQWDEVPIVVVDTETTGKRPGLDRTVSFGFVVTDEMVSAPFPRGSADLRAAADKALRVEMEASIKEPKK